MHKKQYGANKTTCEFEKAVQGTNKLHYSLRLFVIGMSAKSQEAITNVRVLCGEHLKGRYNLDVVDIYQNPLSASENQIFAAPTLIKKLPLPIRKFIGDMTKTEKILAGLDLEIEKK